MIIIHGDDINKISERYNELKEDYKKRGYKIRFSLSTDTSLFPEKILIILDDYKLAPLNSDQEILVISYNLIPKLTLNKFAKSTKTEVYELPKVIWQFLDAFYPGNYKNIIYLFHQTLTQYPIEMLLPLLGKHLRDIYWVKISPSDIPYPSWRVEKLERTAGRFELAALKIIINKLAMIDINSKTSKTNLVEALDLLIISKLQ
jgi:DNA polymerase III delta subunit